MNNNINVDFEMLYLNMNSIGLPKCCFNGIIYACLTLFISACNNGGATAYSEITTQMSSTLPYSTSHAGIQTPVMILFSSTIDPATVTAATFYVESSGGRVTGKVSVGLDNESATFTPDVPFDYGTSYRVYTTEDITDSNGRKITPLVSGNTFVTQIESYVILAVGAPSGKIGAGGIAGADNLCNANEICSSFTHGCKAMLVDDAGTRVAAPAPINWVLQPYSAYHGANNTELGGITGIAANGVIPTNIPLNSAVFGFNLQNNFLKTSYIWTGMNSDWTTAIGNTCSNWSSTTGNGNVGDSGSVDTTFIDKTSAACSNNTYWLYCVQKP